MNNDNLKEWIENMEYDLERLEIVKGNIEHLIKIRNKDIRFLKKSLK